MVSNECSEYHVHKSLLLLTGRKTGPLLPPEVMLSPVFVLLDWLLLQPKKMKLNGSYFQIDLYIPRMANGKLF